MVIICGIDPGISGGIAFLYDPPDSYGDSVLAFNMPGTERDIFDLLEEILIASKAHGYIFMESVHSMPGQGVSSSFKFGRNYGLLRGIITALKYPLHDVSPQKWQKEFSLIVPKGKKLTKVQKKNINKAKAQQLFPQLKVNLAICDALLIAEYGRRTLK